MTDDDLLKAMLDKAFAPREPWKPGEFCDRCQNTGSIDCLCGGDMCICGWGERDCPRCKGRSTEPFEDFDDDY